MSEPTVDRDQLRALADQLVDAGPRPRILVEVADLISLLDGERDANTRADKADDNYDRLAGAELRASDMYRKERDTARAQLAAARRALDEQQVKLWTWAAEEVHHEARWQEEMRRRDRPERDPIGRLGVLESIMRNRALAASRPSPDTETPEEATT